MRSLTELFVSESRRLHKAGKLPEAIVSLENAMHTRDVGAHRYIMEEIIRDMAREHHNRTKINKCQ